MSYKNSDEALVDVPATDNKDPNVIHWLREIASAEKREKDFLHEGSRIVKIMEGDDKDKIPFNILYTNTETLLPALYNNTPRPVVRRRFKDNDPVGLLAARVGERILSFYLDTGESGVSEFDDLLEFAVLQALLPGRGVTAFTYEADVIKTERSKDSDKAAEFSIGEEAEEASEQVSHERVAGNSVFWNGMKFGFARTWSKVPWIAYEMQMTREQLVEAFGEELASQIRCTVDGSQAAEEEDSELRETPPADSEGVKFAQVYQIWDKKTKKVFTLSPGYEKGMLKEVEDPLNLQGFFNCPQPLTFACKISSMVPRPLYLFYENQAKELNEVTTRIQKIVKALRVRGFYDGTLEGLAQLMEKEDNTLIPAENVAAMQQGMTLDKAIWLFPVEKLINVLQQLYVQRQQVKDVIYEITGISDILRGSSVASETATAQNIKNQWGTLRLKRMQKLVMKYVRSCLRIVLEISAKHLSEQTVTEMTGIRLPTPEQKTQAQAIVQAAVASGQPADPNAQTTANSPTMREVLDLLSNDLQRAYRIDIETNSTVDAEATEDKADMGELLNAIAQFLNGVGPMVQQGILPFEASKAMLLGVVRRYRMGDEVEDSLKQMSAPKPPEDPKAGAEKMKAEAELNRMKMLSEIEQQKSAREAELAQLELQLKQQELALREQELRMELEFKTAQHSMRMQELSFRAAQPAVSTAQSNPGE